MHPTALFMTGANGFLGRHLLRHYLPQNLKIFLLVQPKFLPVMQKILARENESGRTKAQVEVLSGDLTVTNLGLSPADADRVRQEASMVLHLAAAYSLTLTHEDGMQVNVGGTRNILDFISGMPELKRFGYLSTTAISGTHTGRFDEDDFNVSQKFKNFYEETKFEAEKLVREKMPRIPTTIFRPTIIVGDSKTGEMEKIDGPYYGLRMIARRLHLILQRAGDVKCHIEPVDFVTRAIVSLMNNDQAAGLTVHLADPNPLTYDDFFDRVIERWGTFRPLLRIPSRWMLPFFSIPGFIALSGVPRESFVYTMTPIDYGTKQMTALLSGTGISCPPVDSYLPVIIDYFRRTLLKQKLPQKRW